MNSDEDLLREEPLAYGGSSRPSPVLIYLRSIETAHRLGNDTEHTHRPALKTLLEALAPAIAITNEPKRIACGAPDLAVTAKKSGLLLGHVEAKDIGVSLDEAKKSEQLKRYLPALANLLLTDYVEFRWFVDGAERAQFRLGEVRANGEIIPDPAAIALGEKCLKEFLGRDPIRIEGAEELARRLARLTHLIRDGITTAFVTGNVSEVIRDWRAVFAQTLLPELADDGREAAFADMFAQTLAYGLFSARVMSPSNRQFTLAEAAKLIPKTNPFLRDFFDLITGPKLDDEPFAGYVQDIVTLLECADLAAILEDFGKGVENGRRRDPVVHFYETFLAAYDPKLRELRGVYYTPEPVVSYIVESVDWLLREKFGLKDGLADKTKFTFKHHVGDQEIEEESHRVLMLDPATGTGTFLFEVIEHIRERFEKKHQAGLWPAYVHEHLLPRLFGFELLMAPYAVAHFKLGLELSGRHLPELWRDTWAYHFQGNERINIFLTNTLEGIEHVTHQAGPLAALTKEANEAAAVKRHRPVLVVLGNPPYSNFGRQNRNDFILGLLDDYKRGLKEKKINLDDDFIKFLRWAQWRIEETGQGVIGYITNNVYLDGLTHRRMRESLLETFDEIYVLNLHGSSKKQEAAPDGSKDDNVFDITVGVAIALFVKLPPEAKGRAGSPLPADASLGKDRRARSDAPYHGKKKPTVIHHADLWGLRKNKYDWLNVHNAEKTEWTVFTPDAPDFRFVPRNSEHDAEWSKAWSLADAFPIGISGIKTHRDALLVDFDKDELKKRIQDLAADKDISSLRNRYNIEDTDYWRLEEAKKQINANTVASKIHSYFYRPFDVRHIFYEPAIIERGDARWNVMQHMLQPNLAMICTRQTNPGGFTEILCSQFLIDKRSLGSYTGEARAYPLYLYTNEGIEGQAELVAHENGRRPNLAAKFVAEFEKRLKLEFIPDGQGDLKQTIGPEDIFHYCYAVLHSNSYRERYADFLRRDYPKVPILDTLRIFKKLSKAGERLVALQANNQAEPEDVHFDVPGSNKVEQVVYVPPKPGGGKVYINSNQYFDGISQKVWELRIGGYQVCEKWLKDRKGRALTHDDIEHYQRTVSALAETRTLMAQIDAIIADHGGWPLA